MTRPPIPRRAVRNALGGLVLLALGLLLFGLPIGAMMLGGVP